MTTELTPEERQARLAAIQLAVEQHQRGEQISARCPACGGPVSVRDAGGPPGEIPNVFDIECPGGELTMRFWGI